MTACRVCGTAVRGSTRWLCAACSALRERMFRESHSPTDSDWIAARNAWFSDPAVLAQVAARARIPLAAGR